MSTISYAQNFEDIMLWRALKHIDKGFYIDVGACFPSECSVTKLFYDEDWCGINIEPNREIYNQLCSERVRDINLNVAVGEFSGDVEYFEFDDEPGSSSVCADIAETHKAAGRPVKSVDVTMMTLAEIFEEHVKSKDVSFLKIDVEGYEKNVIGGMNWKKFRPWILVIEAMKPWLQEPVHDEWEPRLIENDYIFAYTDGLNRFYVAQEHSGLLLSFQYPPNIFDEFKLQRESDLEVCIEELTKELSATAKSTERLSTELNKKNQALGTYEVTLAEQQTVIEKITKELSVAAKSTERLNTELNKKNQALGTHEVTLAEQQTVIEKITKELSVAAKGTERLNTELNEKPQTLEVNEIALVEQQAHSEWLQNEWSASKRHVDELNKELRATYHSMSWRITWPLRKLMNVVNSSVTPLSSWPRSLMRLPKSLSSHILLMAISYVSKRPHFKNVITSWLLKRPRLNVFVRRVVQNSASLKVTEGQGIIEIDPDLTNLTSTARRIFKSLEIAMEQQERKGHK